ncbi:redoxin family protein [Streptomyces sp. N2-109]|uniref:Redoxin family protein n=1 Tax=Streptomyces gossypii TaxID=2883101 RepID=A0ABT2JX25_9ACTN|nr:MerR family transcriptional regulator [Streptomyces gossypii]MCT2592431.1 redoxin family protein [Streptomyces gossypii]
MRAGDAAAAAGVTVKALRYYETLGLLRPARLRNGYRDYSDADVRVAAEVRALRSLGMSPEETRPFLACLREGHEAADDCPESLAAYQQKIDSLDVLIAGLSRSRERLAGQMRSAARRGFPPPFPDESPSTTEESDQMSETPPQPDPLPDALPAPVDDGAARHLPGRRLPALSLPSTDGEDVALEAVSSGRWVLFLYPLTGEPGRDMPRGWDEIPGARGCSQEACGFRDNLAALRASGAERVLALSSDLGEYQQSLVTRLHLPYPLLSDPGLSLAGALGLPTFEAHGKTLHRRLTMIVDGDRIAHVFYPVFPPDTHAAHVAEWLAANPPPVSA